MHSPAWGTATRSPMSEGYQIGHMPFREACQGLEAEGLIEIIPHRDDFVGAFDGAFGKSPQRLAQDWPTHPVTEG